MNVDPEELKAVIAEFVDDRESLNNMSPTDDLFATLAMDSMDVLELIIALEERYQIDVEDSEIENIRTLGDIAHLISAKAVSN